MQFGFKDRNFAKMILHDARVSHSDASYKPKQTDGELVGGKATEPRIELHSQYQSLRGPPPNIPK
jgi:hypothetical protein